MRTTIELEPLKLVDDASSDFDPDEAARGKVFDYLNKLNDLLVKYERNLID